MTWDKWDAKQKTWIFLGAAGIVVLWLLWPSIIPKPTRPPARPQWRQAPKPRVAPQVNRVAARVAPPRAGAPAHAAVTPAPVPAPKVAHDPFADVLGQYVGREMLSSNRGNCVLVLELRRSDKAGEFSGFTRLVCTPLWGAVMAARKLPRGWLAEARKKAANPTLATLTGTADNGSIRLRAVKTFGVRDARDGCAMTALTVTPGGTDAIDVDWQESQDEAGVCRGAQMQMRRVAR